MNRRRKVELLAPAGNIDAFYGAVKAGADAVYLAGDRFGARAYAENFTVENLVQCVRYAHLFGRRVYLAVNTLFKEWELAELADYLTPFYEAGLDAVIVQDLGVLRHIRENFPEMGLHASTQMTLCSGYGAEVLRRSGVDRIVPARELSLKELIAIRRHTDIEIEAFVHGAMCYSYSGQCLFSSILGGRSGNRGRCAQPCRLPYSVVRDQKKTKECYPLSLKDMCTVTHIPLLIQAGIDSFKIEGRMKKPEYAAGVTAIYRKYIDRYYELLQSRTPDEAAAEYQVEKADLEVLASLYNRSGDSDSGREKKSCESKLQTGYYFKYNGREMITLENPAYSENDENRLQEIADKYLNRRLKLPVTVSADFRTGCPAAVRLMCGDLSVTALGEEVERAKNQPITAENVKKQLGKLGDSNFEACKIEATVSKDGFYSLKQLNELRRLAISQLEQLLLDRNAKEGCCAFEQPEKQHKAPGSEDEAWGSGDHRTKPEWVISLLAIEQLRELKRLLALRHSRNLQLEKRVENCRVYLDGDLLAENFEESLEICQQLKEYARLWIALPYVMRLQDVAYLERLFSIVTDVAEGVFEGFLVRSVDELGFLYDKGLHGDGKLSCDGVKCRADAGLYTWNKNSLQELSRLGVSGFCLPYELRAAEQKRLLGSGENPWDFEKIVYSRIPMMISANCALKTTDRCRKNGGEQVYLSDRYRKHFPVQRNCLHCTNIIYNSVPFSLHREVAAQDGGEHFFPSVARRLDFTLESAGEMRAVLETFWDGKAFPFREYTAGHEKRGVE